MVSCQVENEWQFKSFFQDNGMIFFAKINTKSNDYFSDWQFNLLDKNPGQR